MTVAVLAFENAISHLHHVRPVTEHSSKSSGIHFSDGKILTKPLFISEPTRLFEKGRLLEWKITLKLLFQKTSLEATTTALPCQRDKILGKKSLPWLAYFQGPIGLDLYCHDGESYAGG